ncbi:MAG: hypothetical protein FWC13_01335 [Oscillospiraceae bacterium]|nr:hypothetical protein [Oscillospiraceae bacterium]
MKAKKVSLISIIAILMLFVLPFGHIASAFTAFSRGSGEITFVNPNEWIIQFFANNVMPGSAPNAPEQLELRYIKDGARLSERTPTHAQFSPPDAPSGHFYRFIGWNTERNGTGDSFTHTEISVLPITKHMWLYAQWGLEREVVSSTPPSPTPSPSPTPRPQVSPTPRPASPSIPTPAAPTPTPTPFLPGSTSPSTPAPPTPAPPVPAAPAPVAPAAAVPPAATAAVPAPPETDESDSELTTFDEPGESEPDIARQSEPAEDEDEYLTVDDMDDPSGTLEVANGDTPLFGGVPLFSTNGTPTWALLNLILAALGITLAMLALLKRTIADSKKHQDNGQEYIIQADSTQEGNASLTSRKSLWLIIGSVSGVVGVMLFIVFQDITALMVWVDSLTIFHIVIFVIGTVAAILATRRDKDEDDTDDELSWSASQDAPATAQKVV